MIPRLKQANEAARAVLGVAAVLTLVTIVVGTAFNYRKKSTFSFENPQGIPQYAPTTDLSTGWEYALVDGDMTVEQVSNAALNWKPFDVRSSEEFGDTIQGYYWLRKSFIQTVEYKNPSIVLGLVANHHRAFLNDHFIGGSDYFEHIAQYSIDRKILALAAKNTLLVKGYTQKTFRPGLTRLGHLGVVMGEFGQIQRIIQNDTAQFFVVRTVYLAVTFITALILLAFLFFNWNRKYLLYFSIYLLLGTISLLYYNFYVITALNYTFMRFIKVFSLGVGGLMLCSAFFFNSKKHLLELISNITAVIFAAASVLLLLAEDITVTEFTFRYQSLFKVASVLSAVWVCLAIGMIIRSYLRKGTGARRSLIVSFYQIMIAASGFLNGILCLSSAELVSNEFVDFMIGSFGSAHSFVFSVLIIAAGSWEHIRSIQRLEFESEKNRFNLEIVRVLNHVSDLKSTVHIIQERMCQLVGCERSTIYLLEDESKNEFLEASFIYGDHGDTSMVQKVIPRNSGLIGKVLASRQALLVKDVDQLDLNQDNESRTYKTKSCMVVPLIVENDFVGVITVADKKNGKPFNSRNLSLIEGVAMDLALMCKVAKLKSTLQLQLDGIISALAKMIEKRDPYTEFHSQGVMYITESLCKAVKFPISNELRIAAFLHDVGKVFVPKRVLNKPGPLNPKEMEHIRQHSKASGDILKNIPGFEEISLWAGLHHETIDGKGYPFGLTEDLIPFEAQIISVADYIDALATNRSYRPKFDYDKVEEMLKDMGEKNRFNPALVKAGVEVLHSAEFRKLYSERGASYRPEATAEQVVFDYYLEPFEMFTTSLQELNHYLSKSQRKLSNSSLNNTVGTLRSLGVELTELAQHIAELRNPTKNKVA